MSAEAVIPGDYGALLSKIKERVRAAQYEALRVVNRELIGLYWDIGRMIGQRQRGDTWGKSVVQRLAEDLQKEFHGMGGFSAANLWRAKLFFETYAGHPKLAPLVREISWSKNIVIMEKCKDDPEREFYLSALDDLVRLPNEGPSIGIILCKCKDRTIVEYALRDTAKPIGVASYRIVTRLPRELRGQLPPPEAIRKLLEGSQ